MTTITKATTRGQITLPARWRGQFNTDLFLVEEKGAMLQIKPVDKKKVKKATYTVVFNADRDNDGKGIPAEEFAAIIRKTLKK